MSIGLRIGWQLGIIFFRKGYNGLTFDEIKEDVTVLEGIARTSYLDMPDVVNQRMSEDYSNAILKGMGMPEKPLMKQIDPTSRDSGNGLKWRFENYHYFLEEPLSTTSSKLRVIGLMEDLMSRKNGATLHELQRLYMNLAPLSIRDEHHFVEQVMNFTYKPPLQRFISWMKKESVLEEHYPTFRAWELRDGHFYLMDENTAEYRVANLLLKKTRETGNSKTFDYVDRHGIVLTQEIKAYLAGKGRNPFHN